MNAHRRHAISSARSARAPALAGVGRDARALARGRSRGVAHTPATLLVWGWNPMSTAPHLWRLMLEARRAGARLVVVDPYRSRTARVADEHVAAAARDRRRPGARDDARDRRRRARRRRLVPRAHARLRRAARAARATIRSSAARPFATCRPRRSTRLAREFATDPALAAAPRRRRAASRWARRSPTGRSRACPALAGSWRHGGGGFSYIPHGDGGRDRLVVAASGADLRPAAVRTINMSQLGAALTDPTLDPPVARSSSGTRTPPQIAPDQDHVLRGLRARGPVHRRARAVHDRHRPPTPTSSCRRRRSSSTSTSLRSWGHHYLTCNDARDRAARRGEAEHRDLPPARRPAGARRPVLRGVRRGDARLAVRRRRPPGITLGELFERGWVKVDLGQGPAPHADGGFDTPSGQARARRDAALEQHGPRSRSRSTTRPPRSPTGQLAARYPALPAHPEDPPLPQLDVRQPGPPARPPSRAPFVVVHPDDAAARAASPTAHVVRVFNDRGSFRPHGRRLRRHAAGRRRRADGLVEPQLVGGTSCQATTSQRLTGSVRPPPTFNDNRVEIEPQ